MMTLDLPPQGVTLGLPAQFILWEPGISPTGLPTKLPIDHRTGRKVDIMDSGAWMDETTARSRGERIAFVLTAHDPYFFLDLDDCRDGDGWHLYAQTMLAPFTARGAAVEVSQSGNGLHVAGCYGGQNPKLLRNKWRDAEKRKFEFYFQDRFIAFGPGTWQGSWHIDCTELVDQVVPVRDLSDATELQEIGRDPRWDGPENDDDLITRMLGASGGYNQMFGNKASIADLFHAQDLGRFWPDGRGGVDPRSADHPLMSPFAFWTGSDAGRVGRGF